MSSPTNQAQKVTLTFQSGKTREVRESIKDQVVGLDDDGRIVVDQGMDMHYGLTLCCDAFDKGTADAVVCRSCYGTTDTGAYYFPGPDGKIPAPFDPIRK